MAIGSRIAYGMKSSPPSGEYLQCCQQQAQGAEASPCACVCASRAVPEGVVGGAADFKNVSIVAHYIKERTKDAQFIIISLRNNMFELADRLVGIYKTDHATKSVAVNPAQFVVGASHRSPEAPAASLPAIAAA